MGNALTFLPFPFPHSPFPTPPSSEMAHTLRIAVVGGGITGLAAAHRIHELLPRAELRVYEAGPRIGGILDTSHHEGFLIERSADNFLTRLPQALGLCRRLGIEGDLLSTDETRRRAFVVRDGRLVPIPSGFFLMSPRKIGPLLASPILSPLGKFRVLAEPLVPRGPASIHLESEPQTRHARDESVASFARRRLGREAFERLVQPLIGGIYTADPEKLSMAATMPEFLAQERDYGSLLAAARRLPTSRLSDESNLASGARYGLFAAPRQGIASLVEAIAAKLPPGIVYLNAPVASLRQTIDDQWRLDLDSLSSTNSAANDTQSPFTGLILAIPTFAAAQMFEQLDPMLAEALAGIEYAGCNVVSLGYRRDQIGDSLDGFGFVVPQVERRRIIAGSFSSQKFTDRAPTNSVLIRVFIGGALQPELLNLSDDELRRIAIDELGELLRIKGHPMFTDIARWPRAMPQYHVGHVERVARIEKLVARHPHLALAGNAYHGVGIPQCIASAEDAAESIAASLT